MAKTKNLKKTFKKKMNKKELMLRKNPRVGNCETSKVSYCRSREGECRGSTDWKNGI
jgi:hypothetical protein